MSTEEVEVLNTYQSLMGEVQDRVNLVLRALDGKLMIEARATRELCYLQLRFVCECISIACVIAHDGMSNLNVSRLNEAYQADKMVNVLGKLHDRFYPNPVQIVQVSEGLKQLADRSCEFLEKEDLKKLWSKCGSILHRGTPASIGAGETTNAGWQKEVRGYVFKVINLLASHATVMKGDEKVIFYDGINHRTAALNAII